MRAVTMEREPQEGRNDEVTVLQDETGWRTVVWSEQGDLKGLKTIRVTDTIDDFIARRERNGYIIVTAVRIYLPAKEAYKRFAKIMGV